MIYKLQNGGIIKLQNAGSLPKWMQKLNSWSIPDSDESAGEHILNSTIEQANNATTQEERDQIYKDSAKKNLAVTGQSLMMLPMLGEFTTYGLLGGGLRLGTGMAGSKAGEYVLGKGGDWADKKLNTKFLGTTGRILGGLGGWWGGSSATTPLFRTLAGKGVTFHIPQETFMNLRGQYFDKAANKIKLDRSVLPTLQYRDRLVKDYIEFGTKPNLLGEGVSKLVHWDPMTTGTKSALPINGGFNKDPLYFAHFKYNKLVPGLGPIKSKLGNGQLYEHPYHPIFFGGNKPWWEVPGSNLSDEFLKLTTIDKSQFTGPRQYFKRWKYRQRQHVKTMKSWYDKYGEQTKPSRYLITDPENLANYEFSERLGIMGSEVPMSKLEGFEYDPLLGTFKRAKYIDPSISTIPPQEAATTYHYDPRVNVLSRPISSAERKGIIKHERPMYDPEVLEKAKLFAEEYGYPEPKTPEEIKNMYRRHNTFFRTVADLDRTYFPEPYEAMPDWFKQLDLPGQRKILASRGYPSNSAFRGYYENTNNPFADGFVFVSPSLEQNSDYFINGALDNTVKLQRPFSLRDPKTWHKEADWRIYPKNSWKEQFWPKGRIEIGNASPTVEFKASTKHLIPVDIAKPDDLGTLLPDYLQRRVNEGVREDWYKRPKWLSGDPYYGNYEIDYFGILPEKFNYKQGGIIKGQDGIFNLGINKKYNRYKDTTSNLTDDQYVNEFFKYDVFPRYARENPNASEEELKAALNAYGSTKSSVENFWKSLFTTHDGVTYTYYAPYNRETNKLQGIPELTNIEYSSKSPLRSTVVHENTHAYRQGQLGYIGEGSKTGVVTLDEPGNFYIWKGASGYTPDEAKKLNNAYDLSHFKFKDDRTSSEISESGATNAELRYVLWRELYSKLNRRPTLEEMDDYIETYDSKELLKRLKTQNAYGGSSVKYQNDDSLVKDALIHVADNSESTDMTNLAKNGCKLRFTNKLHK